MTLEIRFSEDSVRQWISDLAAEHALKWPSELHCWHSFESADPGKLAEFGRYLESEHGWEFVGMWPSPPKSSNFHLRVKRTALYDLDAVLRDVRRLAKLAAEAGIEVYSSCEPQDGLL